MYFQHKQLDVAVDMLAGIDIAAEVDFDIDFDFDIDVDIDFVVGIDILRLPSSLFIIKHNTGLYVGEKN